MELTLGPILYEWKRDDVRRFYDEVARMPVSRVYIGEVLCSKKNALKPKDIEEIGRMLEKEGKKVVVSTLAVVSNEVELSLVEECLSLPFAIEANDMSVFGMMEKNGFKKEVVAGPHIKTYNKVAVEFLKTLGARRVVFPIELSGDSIASCLGDTGVEGEVFSHGRLPLAFSWRCYSARAYGKTKDSCEHDCMKDEGGIELKTLEGERTFTLSCTSVLSALPQSLIANTGEIKAAGIGAMRISPDYRHTKEVVGIYKRRIGGEISSEAALLELKNLYKTDFVNGWLGNSAGNVFTLPEELATV